MTSNGTKPSVDIASTLAKGAPDSWHDKIEAGGKFEPEKDRYLMYIGLFCPFAHRALLVRQLYGLQEFLPLSIVKPYPKGNDEGWPGWQFPTSNDEYQGATTDPLFHSKYLHEIYFKAKPEYKGRYSVPVIWDKKTQTIVNNESAEVLRWLPGAFEGKTRIDGLDLYPEKLRTKIDEVTEWMQQDLNLGVYKAGFSKTQESYDKMVPYVFAALNRLEKLIAEHGGPYILGTHLTELDVRAYCTVVRFDTVYVQHFKLNLGTIRHDYPQINNWLKNLYWNVPGFKESTDFRHIKENYTKCHDDINPLHITPLGPFPDVEDDPYEPDLKKLMVGSVKMPVVLELEKKLP